jgi:Flp pilus assembly protein TadG
MRVCVIHVLTRYFRRRASDLARFAAAQQAATAVEFAIIAPVFLAMLVAIFQVSIFLFVQQSLQTAATQAGRLFMTGQAQGLSQSAFKTQICQNYLPSVFSCSSLILIVQSYPSFAAANTSAPALYSNGQPITTWAYSPGTQGQIMVVQLVYPWSVVSGPLGFSLANLPNSAAEMMGVTAFRVEPY